jgi:hypothetical protein
MFRRFWMATACCAGLLAAAGCSKKDDAGSSTTTATAAQSVRVTDVQLGRTIDADRRVTGETDDFRPSETIYASVFTEGTAPSATLTARWLFEDGQLVDSTSRTIAPSGAAATEFHISKPSGWPKGKYRLEVALNGGAPETKEFEVEE